MHHNGQPEKNDRLIKAGHLSMSVDTVYLLTLTVTSVERRTTTSRDYDSSQSGTAAAMSGKTPITSATKLKA